MTSVVVEYINEKILVAFRFLVLDVSGKRKVCSLLRFLCYSRDKVLSGRILGRNWDKSLKSFPPCYSKSPLMMDFTPPPPLRKNGLKLVCNVNIVYGNLKSENSQDYAQNEIVCS
jgi:hypothetical protein